MGNRESGRFLVNDAGHISPLLLAAASRAAPRWDADDPEPFAIITSTRGLHASTQRNVLSFRFASLVMVMSVPVGLGSCITCVKYVMLVFACICTGRI